MNKFILILLTSSLTVLAQDKSTTKDYELTSTEFESRELINLENDSNRLVYRVWIEPDLVIEVGQQVIVTLYSKKYDKKQQKYIIGNVKKINAGLNSQILLDHFNSLNLSEWNDAVHFEGSRALDMISDGSRVLIEFSTKERYRLFSLYGPLTDQTSKSKRTLELINFLDEHIDPDNMRIEYYGQLASTDKDAKRRCKEIKEHRDHNREFIDKNILPKMWGHF